ncbi:hypothetical protein SRB5_36260 [Streptomyces sp. RB5]|uniref:DUF6542 domain-containing protein n=1 Tax=Streptomyces smaragdinus TaxID=2585196 RepID=A0A7K0CJ41_9ACTN|nr:hypothetical protein [Streptomyces smaragdinus]
MLETLLAPPGPRLTALGAGLGAAGVMLLTGLLLALFDAHAPRFHGVVFVLVCVLAGSWVRPTDAVTAPVAAPLAFAAGVLAAGLGGSGGLTGQLMTAGTELALQAPWLYAGTLVAAVIAVLRRGALMQVRRARRPAVRRQPPAQRRP